MTTTTRKPRRSMKSAILVAAVSLARKNGLRQFSRSDVAAETGVANATVSWHYGEMDTLRREVVEYAIKEEILPILADARADRNSSDLFVRMSADLKQKVASFIAR